MAKLALARDFLPQLAELSRASQSKVNQTIETFRQLDAVELRAHKGINIEPYTGAKDPRARTIRIDMNHRGIVLDTGDDELFILTYIGTHEKVDRWMMNNTFSVNQTTGALEILNTVEIDAAIAAAPAPEPSADLLYEHRRDRDFTNLGVEEILLPALRAFTDEDQVIGLTAHLPQAQADAVIALLGDDSVDAIYTQIAGTGAKTGTGSVADAITNPASQSEFALISSEDELQEMLAQPLAHWRIFLHPSQHDAAYREVFNGPARVTGGAGTGKTVVAVHRAAFLARRVESPVGRPVLFTTFTRNLAAAIGRDLRDLARGDVANLVDVVNVDALAHRIVRDAEDSQPAVALGHDVERIVSEIVDIQGVDFTPSFIINEWEQVILAQACASRSDYFAVSRAGRGIQLPRRDRATLWKVVEELTRRLTESGKRTYLQLAAAAEGYLRSRAIKPYEHVVVDEAQDLHEAQWRLLRAAVAEGPNDMFIVGDSHQRIYDRRSSLSKVGINIVGRSRKLRINYRTTHEILQFGLAVLGEASFDDLDTGIDSSDTSDYHSFLHGVPPVLRGTRTPAEHYKALAEQVHAWNENGIPAESIAVCARSKYHLEAAESALRSAGIPTNHLGADDVSVEGVSLGTMHRLKGLEFQCVAIVGCDDDSMPPAAALTSAAVDPVQRQHDLLRERCLLYVACTRARDHLWIGWTGQASPFLPEAT